MPAPTPEAWVQIRYAYEHTDRPVAAICAEYRISTGTLRDRMHRWNWARRRPAVARGAPPPTTAAPWHVDGPLTRTLETLTPSLETLTPSPTLPLAGGRGGEVAGGGSVGAAPGAEADPAAIVPRLQSAVARVLPAIEATLTRLAAGPQHPREMEQAARALNTMMRTLRELNALLAQQQARAAPYEETPRDIDELRERLAQRIDAIFQSTIDEDASDEDEPAKAQS